jgi:excisionase family DNA binding protein
MRYQRSKPKENRNVRRAVEAEADEILTVTMMAQYLRCHPSTVYRLLKNKKIPAFRIGSDWRFQKSVIENWLKKATIVSIAS